MGKKFINIKRNKSKQVLFRRNWIFSGIVLVNYLQDITSNNLPFTASFNQHLDMPVSSILKRKLIDIKEMKLREFNFKISHNVRHCNDILHKWRVKRDNNLM